MSLKVYEIWPPPLVIAHQRNHSATQRAYALYRSYRDANGNDLRCAFLAGSDQSRRAGRRRRMGTLGRAPINSGWMGNYDSTRAERHDLLDRQPAATAVASSTTMLIRRRPVFKDSPLGSFGPPLPSPGKLGRPSAWPATARHFAV